MKIPVLYYHEVVPFGNGYTYQKIEIQEFEEQLKFIKEKGYHSLFFNEIEKNDSKIKKPIIITFDDGFRTVYENAYPLLKKYNIKATLFLAPKYIDECNDYYLSWDMVNEMIESRLIEVGSHTYTHIDVRSVKEKELIDEFKLADYAIEKQTNLKPEVFCFPYGDFNLNALKTLKKYGQYRYWVASFFGRTNFVKSKKLIQRIGVKNDDSLTVFERKLKGRESYRGIVQLLRIVKSSVLHHYSQYRIDF